MVEQLRGQIAEVELMGPHQPTGSLLVDPHAELPRAFHGYERGHGEDVEGRGARPLGLLDSVDWDPGVLAQDKQILRDLLVFHSFVLSFCLAGFYAAWLSW